MTFKILIADVYFLNPVLSPMSVSTGTTPSNRSGFGGALYSKPKVGGTDVVVVVVVVVVGSSVVV